MSTPTPSPIPTSYPVTLEAVSKRYANGAGEVVAADNLTLHLDAGSTTALVGRSGSGKSTLLRLIGAMTPPDEGTIQVGPWTVNALTPTRAADYRGHIGFVFQDFNLIPALTLAENVEVPLIGRLPRKARRARALELLARVGLDTRASSYPNSVSGGEQQRVAIARALVVDPGLLLADEPTGNLDTTTSGRVLDLIATLQDQLGITLILATHDPTVAQRCGTALHLRDGHTDNE